MRASLTILIAAVILGCGIHAFVYFPRQINPPPIPPIEQCDFAAGRTLVRMPDEYPVAEIRTLDDELFAYLLFDSLRSSSAFQGGELLLTYHHDPHTREYRIQIYPGHDLLTAIPMLNRLAAEHRIPNADWRYVDKPALDRMRKQTQVFVAAYNMPVKRKLEEMPHGELAAYMRRFLRVKSATDGRVRKGILPFGLSTYEAYDLAADIMTVAHFYDIPLDFFLGIGAMENNFFNMKGDIGNVVWKRRAEKGDIVMRRRGKRVAVLNESSGRWQITRETLRYAHKLLLKDKDRDYTQLPAHLRPSPNLDIDHLTEVTPQVLTTYAGLLFRHLLDEFQGDIASAVGAYNGGQGNPNPIYAEGVEQAALHARRALEQAAVLHGQSVVEMDFIGR